jgi:hypothetical protein
MQIISGGHFIFAAYDTETGKPRYTGGGKCASLTSLERSLCFFSAIFFVSICPHFCNAL